MSYSAQVHEMRYNHRLVLFSTALMGAFQLVAVFSPVLVLRLGGSVFETGLVLAALPLGLLLAPAAIYALSHYSKLAVVTVMWSGAFAAFIAALLVLPGSLGLVVAVIVFQILFQSGAGAYAGLLRGLYPAHEQGRRLGQIRIVSAAALIVVTVVGGFLLSAFSPGPVLCGAAALGLLGSVLLLKIRFTTEDIGARPTVAHFVSVPLKDRRFMLYLAATSTVGFAGASASIAYPLLLTQQLAAPYAAVGVLSAISAIAGLFAYLHWGKRIDRSCSIDISPRISFANALTPLLFLFAPTFYFLLPAYLNMGFASAGWELTQLINLYELAPANQIDSYLGLQSFARGLRALAGTLLGTLLYIKIGPSAMLTGMSLLAASGSLLLWAVARKHHGQRALAPWMRVTRRVSDSR